MRLATASENKTSKRAEHHSQRNTINTMSHNNFRTWLFWVRAAVISVAALHRAVNRLGDAFGGKSQRAPCPGMSGARARGFVAAARLGMGQTMSCVSLEIQ